VDNVREVYNPQINNAGTVVFTRDNFSNTFVSSSTQRVVPEGVNYSALVVDYPAINNAGSIAFYCDSSSEIRTDSGICTQSDFWGTGTVISGKTLEAVDPAPPALNDAGTVVFGAGGVYTPSELVANAGDTIAGKTLRLSPGAPAINNSGVIVFTGLFSDGTSGIVMATPISSGVAGDVNGDGAVDCADLAMIKVPLGKTYGQAGFDPRADVNGDGVIDVRDLAFVAQHLPDGMSCQ
jgi:hypothetical protein